MLINKDIKKPRFRDNMPLIIIPARMASTRLPSKPLVDLKGLPMIVRVMKTAEKANAGPVYIAAGDEIIVRTVEQAGGQAVLTDPDLPSGSDRVYAALENIKSRAHSDIIINLQGDMPVFDPLIIKRLMQVLTENPEFDIATLAFPLSSKSDQENPHCVKLVAGEFSKKGSAKILYFSRANLPWGRGPVYQHIGVYAYRRKALEIFCKLKPTQLEKREKLEQLRGLEAGLCYGVACVKARPKSIDTYEDLERVRKIL